MNGSNSGKLEIKVISPELTQIDFPAHIEDGKKVRLAEGRNGGFDPREVDVHKVKYDSFGDCVAISVRSSRDGGAPIYFRLPQAEAEAVGRQILRACGYEFCKECDKMYHPIDGQTPELCLECEEEEGTVVKFRARNTELGATSGRVIADAILGSGKTIKLHDGSEVKTGDSPAVDSYRYCPKCGQAWAVHDGDGSCVDDAALEKEQPAGFRSEINPHRGSQTITDNDVDEAS